jgi:hypothetical protein
MLSRNLSTLLGTILHSPAHLFEFALKSSGPVFQVLRALLCLRMIAKAQPAAAAKSPALSSSAGRVSTACTA